MITLLLAETEVEALPAPVLRGGREMRVLDASIMPAEGRRGRPDAAISFIRPVLGSSGFNSGDIGLVLHTRDGFRIDFVPGASMPLDRDGYLSAFAELYEKGRCCGGLVKMRPAPSPNEIISCHSRSIVMSPMGRKAALRSVARDGDIVVIGGFTSGELSQGIFDAADDVVSLGDEYLALDEVAAAVLEELTSRVPASSARA
jgi:rRNA pseudouridine-1189 N-methylase Emg1 (Nep1/Mra1 family)